MKLLVVMAVVVAWLLFCGWVLYQMLLDESIDTELMLMLMQEDRDADEPPGL